MTGRAPLVAVSAAQLAAGLAGLAVALRRRRHYDVWLPVGALRGCPEHVARDALFMGTAYSAPVPMLVAQLVAMIRLAARDDRRAVRDLTVLGALMVPGYLSERYDRAHLRRWDRVETPVVLAGTGLAAVMVALGIRDSAAEHRGMRPS
jgi:hypothetical protein